MIWGQGGANDRVGHVQNEKETRPAAMGSRTGKPSSAPPMPMTVPMDEYTSER